MHNKDPIFSPINLSTTPQPSSRELGSHQADAQMRAIIEEAVDAFFQGDASGRLIRVNQLSSVLTGYSCEELLSKNMSDLFSPDELAKSALRYDLLDTGKLITRERLLTRKDGSCVPVEMRSRRMSDGSYQSFFRDITDRKRTEAAIRLSEARLRRAELASRSGNWELYLDTQTVLASEGAAKLYGAEVSEIDYATIKQFPLPEFRPFLDAAMVNLIADNVPYEIDFKIRTGDTGEIRDIHSIAEFDRENRVVFGVIQDYTEQNQTTRSFIESETRFRHLFENNTLAMLLVDAQTEEIVSANQAAANYLGYPISQLTGMPAARIYPKSSRDPAESETRRDDGVANCVERRLRMASGELRDTEIHLTQTMINGRQLRLCIVIDVTERKQAEARMQLAASVFLHAREGIIITDLACHILEVNDTFTQITGYAREEVIGKNPRIFHSGQQTPAFYSELWKTLIESGHWSGEIVNRRKNGDFYPQQLTITQVRDTGGQASNYVALFSDITAIREHQKQLEHVAHHDVLTNLPNRALLTDRLHQAINYSQRLERSLAVVYLDLDGFKQLNDRFGHDVGDEFLTNLAQRMKGELRDGDTLARFGGDEFIAVLGDLERSHDCEPIIARLLAVTATPVTIRDMELQVSASIGVTLYPHDGADADQLIRHADQAMYLAKQAGKNCYHLFDVDQDAAVKTLRATLDEIERALERREFVLHYQPKVNMRTGQVIGAEALIRWQHPERGLLPPKAFLPMIEDHPICVAIGEWVINSALDQMVDWDEQGLRLPISVNVGARQMQQEGFIEQLTAALAARPSLSPDRLEIEILESSALEDISQVSEIMLACCQIGVDFALDDFGTGYSSLTYLRRLPAKLLKIDQSFVRDMLVEPDDLAIVQGVIGLAAAFSRYVIAEGVESIAHGEQLLKLGCELAQGYGIARPMPGEEMPAWAADWHPDASWTDGAIGKVSTLR